MFSIMSSTSFGTDFQFREFGDHPALGLLAPRVALELLVDDAAQHAVLLDEDRVGTALALRHGVELRVGLPQLVGEFGDLLAVRGVLLLQLGELRLDRGDLRAQLRDELPVLAVLLAQLAGLGARLVQLLLQAIVLRDQHLDLLVAAAGQELLHALALLGELLALGVQRLPVVAGLVELLLEEFGALGRVRSGLLRQREIFFKAGDLVFQRGGLAVALVVCFC